MFLTGPFPSISSYPHSTTKQNKYCWINLGIAFCGFILPVGIHSVDTRFQTNTCASLRELLINNVSSICGMMCPVLLKAESEIR